MSPYSSNVLFLRRDLIWYSDVPTLDVKNYIRASFLSLSSSAYDSFRANSRPDLPENTQIEVFFSTVHSLPCGFISFLVPILPDITKLTPVMGGFAQKLVCIQSDKFLSCRNSHVCPAADVMCLLDSHVKHEGFCMEFPPDEINQIWLKFAKVGPKLHF